MDIDILYRINTNQLSFFKRRLCLCNAIKTVVIYYNESYSPEYSGSL